MKLGKKTLIPRAELERLQAQLPRMRPQTSGRPDTENLRSERRADCGSGGRVPRGDQRRCLWEESDRLAGERDRHRARADEVRVRVTELESELQRPRDEPEASAVIPGLTPAIASDFLPPSSARSSIIFKWISASSKRSSIGMRLRSPTMVSTSQTPATS